jgi:hypothetical protein
MSNISLPYLNIINGLGLETPPAAILALPFGEFLEACKAERDRLVLLAKRDADAAESLARSAASQMSYDIWLASKMQAEEDARNPNVAESIALAKRLSGEYG